MKISTEYKNLKDTVTPTQIQFLLNNNSLYKTYRMLGVSEPLLLRYIIDHNLTFEKAFRTLADLSESEKNMLIEDWKTTLLSKKELREKYKIGPKALNRFLKSNNIADRDTVRINPELLAYQKLVRRLTEVVKRHYKLTSPPGYEWDHKFSVYEGFYQNIHPSIIASRENLELISIADNRSNGKVCSISRDALIDLVCANPRHTNLTP
jgi:hypothetical protein